MKQNFPFKIYSDRKSKIHKGTKQKHQYRHSTKISDIWNITNSSNGSFNRNDRNLATFFQTAKPLKKQGKNCTQLFDQLPKSISNKQKLSITNITKLRNFDSNTNADTNKLKAQNGYGTKMFHNLSRFKTHSIDKYHSPLVNQLKQSLSNIDCKMQVAKLKRQYDTLLTIKSIEKLSTHELIILPYTSKQNNIKYVLHIDKNMNINDNFINYHIQDFQVAILTKSMIKLLNDTYWCLSWKLIRKKS